MSKFFNVTVDPSTLKTAREELHITLEQVEEHFSAAKARSIFGVDKAYLKAIESKETEIPFGILSALSAYYDKPVAYFFSRSPQKQVIVDPSTDKRTYSPVAERKQSLTRDTLIEVKHAKAVQVFAQENLSDFYSRMRRLERADTNTDVSALAQRYRRLFDLDGKSFKGKHKAYFEYLRAQIESLGVVVIQASLSEKDDIRGLSFMGHRPYLMVVNKKDGYEFSYAPRIFTLMHELGHMLLRDNSLCDENRHSTNQQEIFCNRFAAQFLVPEISFKEELGFLLANKVSLLESAIELRKKFTVSFDVIAWRLKEFRYVDDEGAKALIADWKKQNIDNFKPKHFNHVKIETQVKNAFGEILPKELFRRGENITPTEIAGVLSIKLDDFNKVRHALG